MFCLRVKQPLPPGNNPIAVNNNNNNNVIIMYKKRCHDKGVGHAQWVVQGFHDLSKRSEQEDVHTAQRNC